MTWSWCHRFRATGDLGSATVWALVLIVALGSAGTVFAALAQVAVARHRAGAAADLAALAAAAKPYDEAGGCVVARRVAAAQGGRLQACTLRGDLADVTVEVALSGRLAALPAARVRARAGPTQMAPRTVPVERRSHG